MRFESVTAHCFGPFAGRTLDLKAGMNVLWGLNESGKSTWHSALYVALCGRPRRKGKQNREEDEFESKHKPWDREEWRVSAIIHLQDNRRVELTHDLLSGADSTVLDTELGRDYRGEIMFEGAPDGSVWLGLDRRSFVATACVQQTDMLTVIRNSAYLQEHLQRAAASAAGEATAAQAIARVKDFLSEQVGHDRRNSSRPLRQAIERAEHGEQSLARAHSGHAEYLKLVAVVNDLRAKERDAMRQFDLAQAVAAMRDAEGWSDRLIRAKEIARRLGGAPPSSPKENTGLLQNAPAALQAWRQRPAPPKLDGTTSQELRGLIERLSPESPKGDMEPRIEVEEAFGAFERLNRELSFHDTNRPIGLSKSDVANVSAEELRNLSSTLAHALPAVDAALFETLQQLRQNHQRAIRSARSSRVMLVVFGAVFILTALVLLLMHYPIPAAVGAVLGAGFILMSFMNRAPASLKALSGQLARAEEEAKHREYEAEYWARLQEEARARIAFLRLSPDPTALRLLAEGLETASRNRTEIEKWKSKRLDIEKRVESAGKHFWSMLESRDVSANGNATDAIQRYRDACRQRWVLAQQVDRRKQLEEQLRIREQLELTAEEAEEKAKSAEEGLRKAAAKCGLQGVDDRALAAQLQSWITQQQAERAKLDEQMEEWGNLQQLTGGIKLEDFERDAEVRTRKARELTSRFQPQELQRLAVSEGDLDELVQQLQTETRQIAASIAALQGQIAEREKSLASVPEAEEELEAARAEVQRIESLKHILETTESFLERAQEQAHRSIAPVLRESVGRRLPDVTAGRYWDVRVDPETLSVQVCGANGRWREATTLSHGTAEQIYMLLRVALAERLTRPGEVCPLLLDDVTVHSDSERTHAILQCLHNISRERQVILFSQQAEVLDWAENNLTPGPDNIIRLDPGDVGV